jgi:EpsI family protein
MLALPPRATAESRLSELPEVFLGLPSEEVPTAEMVLEDLNPNDLLLRRYTRPDGKPLWLVVIFFENARWGAHDPRLCYVSQGFHLVEDRNEIVPLGDGKNMKVNYFLVRRGSQSRAVLSWWYVPGSGTTTDAKTYRRLLMLEGFKSNTSYGAFVRISTPTFSGGADLDLLKAFAQGISGKLPTLIGER